MIARDPVLDRPLHLDSCASALRLGGPYPVDTNVSLDLGHGRPKSNCSTAELPDTFCPEPWMGGNQGTCSIIYPGFLTNEEAAKRCIETGTRC